VFAEDFHESGFPLPLTKVLFLLFNAMSSEVNPVNSLRSYVLHNVPAPDDLVLLLVIVQLHFLPQNVQAKSELLDHLGEQKYEENGSPSFDLSEGFKSRHWDIEELSVFHASHVRLQQFFHDLEALHLLQTAL
jgi:hypothetical protein